MAATIARNICRINFCVNGIKQLELSKPVPSSVLKDVYRTAWYRSFFRSDQTSSPSQQGTSSNSADTSPSKPKRPPNVFLLYLQSVQDGIKKSNPELKRKELLTEAAKKWRDLDPERKAKIAMERKELYEKYKAENTYYLENRTPEQIKLEEKEKGEKQTKKIKKARKELGMPQRPWSSYTWFLSEKFAERSGEPVRTFFKEAKDRWNALSDQEKNVYYQKHKQSKEQYENNMATWEESMIEEGNFAVIRKSTLQKLKQADRPKQSRRSKKDKVDKKGGS